MKNCENCGGSNSDDAKEQGVWRGEAIGKPEGQLAASALRRAAVPKIATPRVAEAQTHEQSKNVVIMDNITASSMPRIFKRLRMFRERWLPR